MTCGFSPVRTVPGRSLNTSHCRHCSEYETLAHVLGYCRQGETLRIKRHNNVRTVLAKALRKKGYEVEEEVVGISEKDSIRRIDILASDRTGNYG